MRIREKKFIRGSYVSMAFVFLLSLPVGMGVECKWEEQETLLAYLIDSGEINQEMAESLRSNCRHELLHAKKILQDLELCFVKERSISSEELVYGRLPRIQKHDALNVLCPQVKQILLDCLREKNLMLPVTGEKMDLDTWYTRYLGSLFPRQYSSRRRELAQKSSEEPAPFPTIIIAVGVTACVTFVVAVLLFYCCCNTGFGSSRNDERPLLSLSLSDNSVASSRKSFTIGSSRKEEKLGSQSFNSLAHNRSSGNLYMESHSLSNSKIESPLDTTAGVAANSVEISAQVLPVGTPVFPPLKPPPGRIIPPNPSPVTAAPPPPPAPIPPAPLAPMPPAPPPPTPTAPRAPAPPPPPPMRPSGGPRRPAPRPPPPPPVRNGPRPPPPPPMRSSGGPPRPPPFGSRPPRPLQPVQQHPATSTTTEDVDASAAKAKLKPFFWDKVMANPDDSMVWNQIKAGSFQFNEEMIESLFGYAPPGKNKTGVKKESSSQDSPRFIQIIDSKKAQNLSILLKALNVTTEEVCDALEEGNELPSELIHTLLKMAPTAEEELKLRLFNGDLSQLGPAERFLKVMVEIPFAFKRLDCLLFMCSLDEETATLKESFIVLEAACTELRRSRLFLKLLEAVLKTGNRMNSGTFRGGAQAFKLDTLLKLSDVKGVDGKTTLLHFVVQEIIRSEGMRAARAAREMRSMSSFKSEDLSEDFIQDSDEQLRSIGLQVVSGLGNDLQNVKRAAALDVDSITGTVAKLGHSLLKAREFLNSDMKNVAEDNGFHQALRSFVENSESDVMWLLEEEKRITALIKSTADYFHGNAGKDEGLRLFLIVRDFLVILDKVCKEVKCAPVRPGTTTKAEEPVAAPPDPQRTTPAEPRRPMPPAIANMRPDSSDSSDTSSSDDD